MIVLVCCMPKTGSTFLSSVIGNFPGFCRRNLVPAHERREQELCEDLVEHYASEDICAQQHVRASNYTIHLIEKYNVIPIVLVRNIFDIVVSLHDHITNEGEQIPFAYISPDLKGSPLLTDALIDLAVPWCFNFYVSWWYSPFRDHIFTYEQLVLGGAEEICRTMDFLGVSANAHEVSEIIRNTPIKNTRFNKGRSGRGAELLSAAQKRRIAQMRSYYQRVDFLPIGLE